MAYRKLNLPWEEIDPRLGVENDTFLGVAYGCNAITIYRRRLKLGIAPCKTQSNYFDWEPHYHLLGTMFDYDLGQLLGIHETTVSNERWARGIPAFVDPKRGHHIDWDSVDLGLRADETIAEEYNVGTHIVIREREKRGIPCFGVNGRRLDWEKYGHLFGCTPEREIAQITGFELSTIIRIRDRHGIPAYKFTYITEENERVDSYPEAVIDIYFHQKGIPHKFHVRMGDTRYHCDWIINGDTAVEFAGYADHPKYKKAYKEKLAKKLVLYESLGYKTQVIYYKDLKNYDLDIPPKHTGHLIMGA